MSLKSTGGKQSDQMERCDVHDARHGGHGRIYKEVNNIMKLWHYLSDSRECLCFIRFMGSDDPHKLIAVANTVFATLWPVVRPLSVDLTIAARQNDFPVIDNKIPVPVRVWHLYEMYPPAHVSIRTWASKYSEEAIPELTLQALADWLARAHAQQLPEGYVPILDKLCMDYTRARLLQDQEPSAELASGMVKHAVPVEKREDGLWVSGPLREGMVLDPPIEVELVSDQGVQDLYISIYWSPWIEAGSAEAELLTACLHELEKQGWEAD